jgi:hypothetical protein
MKDARYSRLIFFPGDPDDTFFEWLTENFYGGSLELVELIEE